MDITVSEANTLTGTPEVTIRRWIREERISSTIKDNIYFVDKREILLQDPTVFTMFIEKGGTGKTAIVSMMADYYAAQGLKVLVVGLDPQINVEKRFFDYQELKENKSLYDYFENNTNLNKIVMKYDDNIHVLPASKELSKKRYQYDVFDMEQFVKDFNTFYKKYDIILQDCGPVIDSLSKFGIMTANFTLIPFIPEPDSYDGVLDAILAIKQIRKYSEKFKNFKAILNNHDQTGRYGIAIHNQFKDKAQSELGNYVTQNSIPSFVGVKERRSSKKSIFESYPNHKYIDQLKTVLEEIDHMAFEGRE